MALQAVRSQIEAAVYKWTRPRPPRLGVAVPRSPPGTGILFHTNMQTIRYSLSPKVWVLVTGAALVGVFSGQRFAQTVLLSKNPPNPPRYREKPPVRHPHTPDEDEDED
ncbi:conserved hypothetical protein [Perkinsus marinus ATCC 50983]|uniref:Uncharacterized protein n=2 Tax=Perkinsus marinus TaxID=31276 RepID=C5LDS7_PERM5|nr:conserved hypothetical protein [Perkinsus marinus ATCC 50983]EER05091.1 conserved hypothetical protein [Perkinsus marinus ATCC 50983]|eukprot:XP_002773275.1 conserved hypothetical protein [Perkinsus marinus ATCC 50983]